MKKITCLSVSVLITFMSQAAVTLPKLFTDGMVLQRDKNITIWGWADPKEKVSVTLNKQAKSAVTDKSGKWSLTLGAESAGGPYTLTVKGKNTITVNDVLVGEVWICSGQSNMEMPIAGWGLINNYQQEIAEANYPQIRQFAVPKKVSLSPQTDVEGDGWKVCNPENAPAFSAVAYFFARDLYKELKVPVGLINTTWGGTMVETWTSREAYENSPEFKEMISRMPKVDLAELQRERAVQAAAKLSKLQGGAAKQEEIKTWNQPSFNDNNWGSLNVPGVWEEQELGELDGIVWLRKTIEISAADAGKKAVIELAMIDDKDESYVNGKLIGSTAAYNAKRVYEIPAGILTAGKNVIAVRVTDGGGGGGIYGDVADLKLTIGSNVIPLNGKWTYRIEKISQEQAGVTPNSYPTLLFNAMINPLIPYTVRGAIWYQGETNAGRSYEYRKSFPLMITDWRQRWKLGDFPFYFVQLASFKANNGDSEKGSGWAELREAQLQTLSLPNTGMAVTTDIGDTKDIHPKNKQDVGKRLAAIALNQTYHKANAFSGPVYQSFRTEGDQISVTFSHAENGLIAKDKYGYVKGFEIAGADQKFYFATATIEGNKVIVKSPYVKQPVAVRFGWADDAVDDNLYNKEGFPAGPFRTDNWKGITESVRYTIQ
ncbi:MAG: sialate O-acetylesterase [Chitinophagaceae bacterium]